MSGLAGTLGPQQETRTVAEGLTRLNHGGENESEEQRKGKRKKKKKRKKEKKKTPGGLKTARLVME